MASKDTIWKIEPHTSAKHEILSRYLKAWFPILDRYHGRMFYVDGFCGPGRYEGGEKGSPLIALDAAMQHTANLTGRLNFRFFDERADRIEHLRSELKDVSLPANLDAQAQTGKFHELAPEVLSEIKAGGGEPAPSFVFVDPFGFSDIPISLIRQFLSLPRCEVFINFMVDFINRFLTHPDQAITEHMVQAFGTDECLSVVDSGGEGRVELLRALYQRELSKSARFVRYFEMRGRSDRPIYFLFFATNSPRGHEKMKEAMWRVDPEGTYSFSDATNPDQLVLLREDSTSKLTEVMCAQFAGRKSISTVELKAFVIDKTAFLEKHMKAALVMAEEQGSIEVADKKADGKPRKKRTFPDGVLVTFTRK